MTEFLIGGVVALGLRWYPITHTLRFWALALGIAALIYVGFALFGGAPTAWLLLELGGLIAYAALAYLSLRFSPWLLALGWAAHIAWDTIVHRNAPSLVPEWYTPVCVGFDLIVAVIIGSQLIAQQGNRRPT